MQSSRQVFGARQHSNHDRKFYCDSSGPRSLKLSPHIECEPKTLSKPYLSGISRGSTSLLRDTPLLRPGSTTSRTYSSLSPGCLGGPGRAGPFGGDQLVNAALVEVRDPQDAIPHLVRSKDTLLRLSSLVPGADPAAKRLTPAHEFER